MNSSDFKYERYRDTKSCFIPTCSNTDKKNPGLKFFNVREQLKENWCQLAGRNCPKSRIYCCQDHLNPEEDIETYKWSGTTRSKLKLTATLKNFQRTPVERNENTSIPTQASTSSSNVFAEFPFCHSIEEDVENYRYWKTMNNTPAKLKPRVPALLLKQLKKEKRRKRRKRQTDQQRLGGESKQDAEPDPTSLWHPNSPGTTDISNLRDPLRKTIEQCRFCGDFSKECVVLSSQPYVVGDTTTLSLNDMSIQLDFNTLPNTICEECDKKLTEFSEFVKLVKTTQDSLINVVKTEPEEIADDALSNVEDAVCNIEYVKTEIPDDADITETDSVIKTEEDDNKSDEEDFSIFEKPVVIKQPKRKVIDTRQAKVTKKVKHVTVACEDDEYVDAKADIDGTRSSEVNESDICTARIFSKKKKNTMENVPSSLFEMKNNY